MLEKIDAALTVTEHHGRQPPPYNMGDPGKVQQEKKKQKGMGLEHFTLVKREAEGFLHV